MFSPLSLLCVLSSIQVNRDQAALARLPVSAVPDELWGELEKAEIVKSKTERESDKRGGEHLKSTSPDGELHLTSSIISNGRFGEFAWTNTAAVFHDVAAEV